VPLIAASRPDPLCVEHSRNRLKRSAGGAETSDFRFTWARSKRFRALAAAATCPHPLAAPRSFSTTMHLSYWAMAPMIWRMSFRLGSSEQRSGSATDTSCTAAALKVLNDVLLDHQIAG